MLRRILLCYLGAVVITACLLPVAVSWTMGGHSLMYAVVYALPIGIAAGLWYSDLRQHYFLAAALWRSVVGLLMAVLVIFLLTQVDMSPFWKNDGWILIPLCTPLVAAIVSGLVFRARVRPQT